MSRFYLIRHGETLWNKESKYQGQSNIPLSDNGRLQAKRLSERLKEQKIDAIYASDLHRAMETAEIIAAPHRLEVFPTREMRELNFGIWEGFTFDEIVKRWPGEMERWRRDPYNERPEGGETMAELCCRTSMFLKNAANAYPDKNILVVTHAGPIRALLSVILNLHYDLFWKFKISNASLTVVEYDGQKELNRSGAYIVTVNDTYHLYI
ncbi:MAG TPA: alpha-ribazole phosphatase [Thermoanaerobacterales bacterium]|nr:alpha-ribazole phosphatase [Thermoanaerobacterales bacterium]